MSHNIMMIVILKGGDSTAMAIERVCHEQNVRDCHSKFTRLYLHFTVCTAACIIKALIWNKSMNNRYSQFRRLKIFLCYYFIIFFELVLHFILTLSVEWSKRQCTMQLIWIDYYSNVTGLVVSKRIGVFFKVYNRWFKLSYNYTNRNFWLFLKQYFKSLYIHSSKCGLFI